MLAQEYRRRITAHLARDGDRYASFLRRAGSAGEGYRGDLLADALHLPIPVLV